MTERRFPDSQRRSAYRSTRFNRGGILILALWSICLLATFAVVLSYGVRQKVTLVKRLDDRDKLRFISDALVKKAIVEVKLLTGSGDSGQGQSWSAAKSAFSECLIGDGKIRYAIIDEERKININKAKRSTMENLFVIALGMDDMDAQELAASLVDWRDGDSNLSTPVGSAEDRYYRNLQFPYEAKDREFEVLDEILLVKGVDAEMFEKLKDYATIYGDGKVNINTASKATLLALGFDKTVVDLICLYRIGEDGLFGTADDNVFGDPLQIAPNLSQLYHLSDSQLANLTQNIEQLITNSYNFNVRGVATLDRRGISSRVDCIINIDGAILYWNET